MLLLPYVLSGGIVIFGLAASGKRVVYGCPRIFGMWLSCSWSVIVLSALIFVTGSMEDNFILGISTCFFNFVVC